jgi:hypothetical protein
MLYIKVDIRTTTNIVTQDDTQMPMDCQGSLRNKRKLKHAEELMDVANMLILSQME